MRGQLFDSHSRVSVSVHVLVRVHACTCSCACAYLILIVVTSEQIGAIHARALAAAVEGAQRHQIERVRQALQVVFLHLQPPVRAIRETQSMFISISNLTELFTHPRVYTTSTQCVAYLYERFEGS